jgi:hypothetical protein
MPAATNAAILDLLSILPPVIIAHMWPILRAGGAVCPVIKLTTGKLRALKM